MSRIEEIKKFLKSLAPNELEQAHNIVNDLHSIVNDHHEHSIESIIDLTDDDSSNESTTDNPKEKNYSTERRIPKQKAENCEDKFEFPDGKNEKNPKQRAILHQERYTTSIAIVEEMEKELAYRYVVVQRNCSRSSKQA